jgi:hypothetical protein
LAYLDPLGDWLAITGSPTGISSSYLQPAGVPTFNSWYHLVYQYDNVNNLQSLYLNGVAIATATASSIIGYDNREWTIGAEYENGSMAYFLNGKIDDVGIWERILTPCEIAQLYAASAFSATSSSSIICSGQTTTLTASGASSYLWNNAISGANYTVIPNANTVYSVSGTYPNNVVCTATVMQNVATLSVTQSAPLVCAGQTSTLTASGANSYLWNNSFNGPNFITNPVTSTVYSVTGFYNNNLTCSASIQQNVALLLLTQSSPVICVGQTATITATGANSYVWNNAFNGSNYIINPSSNTVYTVSGTYANNVVCTSTIMQSVDKCTAVEKLTGSGVMTIRLFPNPANQVLILEFNDSSAEKAVVQLSNSLGELLNCESGVYENQIHLDVKNLPGGLYFLSIESKSERQTIKFLKE